MESVTPPLSESLSESKSISRKALAGDLLLDTTKFHQSSVSSETFEFNRKLQAIEAESHKWYDVSVAFLNKMQLGLSSRLTLCFEVGAATYRLMRKQGLTALPGVTLLPSAATYSIPSRDPGRFIPCRILKPQQNSTRAILLHFHGGGFVLNDEESSDPYLQRIADSCELLCISVGYRLAPENPFPAAPRDCEDVAEWLIDNGPSEFGQRLSLIGGESAGANLAVLTTLSLLRSRTERYQNAAEQLKGLLLHYGTYSMHWHPGTKIFKRSPTLVLDEESLSHFRRAYLPGAEPDTLVSPQVSPFHADLSDLQLPPALLTCGTEDCLVEDSAFMSVRWMIAGGRAILKLYPGSPHGFILFSPGLHQNTMIALQDVQSFVEMAFL
jgi:acetyl esterase/lipase